MTIFLQKRWTKMGVWTLKSTGYIAHFSLMHVHFLYLKYNFCFYPETQTLQQVMAAKYSVIHSLTYKKMKHHIFFTCSAFSYFLSDAHSYNTHIQYGQLRTYLIIFADHVQLYDHNVPTIWWFLQVNKVLCHETQMTSNLFTEDESELTVLRWSSRSPNLSTIE